MSSVIITLVQLFRQNYYVQNLFVKFAAIFFFTVNHDGAANYKFLLIRHKYVWNENCWGDTMQLSPETNVFVCNR